MTQIHSANAALEALDKFITYRDRIAHSPTLIKALPILGVTVGILYTLYAKGKKINSDVGIEFAALGLIVGTLPLAYNILYPSPQTTLAPTTAKAKKFIAKQLDFDEDEKSTKTPQKI